MSLRSIGETSFSWSALRRVGPAFVLAAAIIGPGTVVVYSIAGAVHGYQLLWVFPVAGVFAAVYVEMFARFGIASDATLWSAVRDRYGVPAAVLGGVVGAATAMGYQTGNVLGVGVGMELLTGVSAALWGTALVAVGIGFIWLRDLYRWLEKLILVLVAVMLVGFAGSLALAGLDAGSAASGLVPSLPDGTAFLVLVMMATYFSMYGAVYQSYLVGEKGYLEDDTRLAGFDAVAAMAVLGILGMLVLLTAATVLDPDIAGDITPATLATQLEPFAGEYAFVLFGVGLFAASFSSLVANALIGGVLLSDGLGYDASFDGTPVKLTASVLTLAGWSAGFLPRIVGTSPLDTIVLAQAFSVIALPYFGAVGLVLLNDRDEVGRFTNSRLKNVVAVVGYLLVIGMAVVFLRTVAESIGLI
ncbi:MAG: Nramp family divalent metal transporter [Halobacteriales archaeon]|nr:Nramp family divalent metal transporter [Halobacteriales archaeon]